MVENRQKTKVASSKPLSKSRPKNENPQKSCTSIMAVLGMVGIAVWLRRLPLESDENIEEAATKETASSRTSRLPLLDSLFPHQSLDGAWEEHPLLSTIYSSPSLCAESEESKCTSPNDPIIYSDGRTIPTVYVHEKALQRERLDRVQQLISPLDVNKVMSPPGYSMKPNQDYRLVKKYWRNGQDWVKYAPKRMDYKNAMEEDYSLSITQIQLFWKSITAMARSIEGETNPQHVGCNLYMTPPPKENMDEPPGAFDRHWDAQDVFIFQVSGEKLWSVAKHPTIEMTTRDMKRKPTLEEIENYRPYDEFLLRPGDVLYIPRGFLHNATITRIGQQVNVPGPRFAGVASVHLTFGVAPECQTTVEALVHHAIAVYSNTMFFKQSVAIASADCKAGGRDIPWKDVMHFVVAEVARRKNTCFNDTKEPNNCWLRKLIPIDEGFQQVARSHYSSRVPNSALSSFESVQKAMLLDAFSIVLDLADIEQASQFVRRFERRQGEYMDKFCHPYLQPETRIPCFDAMANVDQDTLRSHLQKAMEMASVRFEAITKTYDYYRSYIRNHYRTHNDDMLKRVGQFAE